MKEKIKKISKEHFYKQLIICDFDYLSARLNFMCGLIMPGLGKTSETIEKSFKLLLSMRGISSEELKEKFRHSLRKLTEEIGRQYKIKFGEGNHKFLKELEEAYSTRYAENWKEEQYWNPKLKELDSFYFQIRNKIVENFPDKNFLKERSTLLDAAHKGTIFLDLKSEYGSMKLEEIFKRANYYWEKFITIDKLA